MKDFLASRSESFRHALRGLRFVVRTQPNMWIHPAAAIVVFLLAIWLRLSVEDWAVLVLTVGLVLTAELLNTAIEATIDLASSQLHPLAKIGKDVAAAAVLVAAILAVVVGLLIFGPPLWSTFTHQA